MSGGTFSGINTALRGLLAHQAALDVTGHNIANLNTEGYSRQRADFTTAPPISLPGFSMSIPSQIGTGVELEGFSRLRDQFLDLNMRTQLADEGRAGGYVESMDQLDGMLLEPGDNGLSALLNRFFTAVNELSTHPDNITARQVFIQSADALADGFNRLGDQMADLLAQSDLRVDDDIDRINTISAQIADLNETIRDSVNAGQDPNDLRDRRDQLMDELAALTSYTYTVNAATEEVTITFDATAAVNLVDPTVAGGFNTLTRAQVDAAYASGDMTSGHMYAHEDQFTTRIPAFQTQLDDLVASIVGGVNAQHALGFDLNGAAGGDAFTAGGITASTMSVNAALAADPRLVAASSVSGAPGNGGNALALLALRDTVQGAPLNATWEDFYGQFVGGIGTFAAAQQRAQAGQEALVATLKDRRAQVSGVSLDEEMSNMLRFQHAYNASARVMSAMDDVLDTLINRTGRVGL